MKLLQFQCPIVCDNLQLGATEGLRVQNMVDVYACVIFHLQSTPPNRQQIFLAQGQQYCVVLSKHNHIFNRQYITITITNQNNTFVNIYICRYRYICTSSTYSYYFKSMTSKPIHYKTNITHRSPAVSTRFVPTALVAICCSRP
jgi:hypothetical protein